MAYMLYYTTEIGVCKEKFYKRPQATAFTFFSMIEFKNLICTRAPSASLKILIKLDVYALSLSLLLRKIQLPPRGNVVKLRDIQKIKLKIERL